MQRAEFVDGVFVVSNKSEIEGRDRRRFRGLKDFKHMTDEEFNAYWDGKNEEVALDPVVREDFEKRIQGKIEGFKEDYDLSDMKFNDTETLRALAQSMIQLEDLEQAGFRLREQGITFDNLTLLDKLAQQMSRTRLDMLKLQEDLKISRKVRQSDKNESAINELEDLKAKAKQFYEEKMIYIFCPECKMLLGTTWLLYADADNEIKLHCKRPLDTGEICGHTFIVKFKDIVKQGSNTPDIMPRAMR